MGSQLKSFPRTELLNRQQQITLISKIVYKYEPTHALSLSRCSINEEPIFHQYYFIGALNVACSRPIAGTHASEPVLHIFSQCFPSLFIGRYLLYGFLINSLVGTYPYPNTIQASCI